MTISIGGAMFCVYFIIALFMALDMFSYREDMKEYTARYMEYRHTNNYLKIHYERRLLTAFKVYKIKRNGVITYIVIGLIALAINIIY